MNTREHVRALLDQVPDHALPSVARYLEAVLAGCPPDNPYDEPLSAEEEAMIALAHAEIASGHVVSHEELGARLDACLRPNSDRPSR